MSDLFYQSGSFMSKEYPLAPMLKYRKPFLEIVTNDSFNPLNPGASNVPDTIRQTTIIQFDCWGSTDKYELPVQNDRPVAYRQLCRQLFRSFHLPHHEPMILGVLMTQPIEDFVSTIFWVHFLEHFALINPEPYLEHYRKTEAQKAHEEQQAAANHGVKPLLGSKKHPSSERKGKGPATLSEGKKKSSAFMPGGKPTKGDQLKAKPRHLMHSREAGQVIRPNTLLTEEALARNQNHLGLPLPSSSTPRAGRGKGDVDALIPTRPRSVSPTRSTRSNATSASRASSSAKTTLSLITMGSTTRGPRVEVEPGEGMYVGAVGGDSISTYQGPRDIVGIGELLLDAEIIEDPLPLDQTNIPKAYAKKLEVEAITLIRQEQDRIIGRLAQQYVGLLHGLSRVEREYFMPVFPDLVSNLVVQILNRVLPYCRELLTSEVKQHIKKVTSYWIHGVENSDVSQWEIKTAKKMEVVQVKKKLQRKVEENRIPKSLRGKMTNRYHEAKELREEEEMRRLLSADPSKKGKDVDDSKSPVPPTQPSTARSGSGGDRPGGSAKRRLSGEAVKLPQLLPVGGDGASTAKVPQPPSTSGGGGTPVIAKPTTNWKTVRTTVKTAVKAAGLLGHGVGEQVYATGLEQMRQAFEDMRRGDQSASMLDDDGTGGPQYSQFGAGRGGPVYGQDRKRRLQNAVHYKPPERHIFFHRHAPANKRACWNELGKAKKSAVSNGVNFHFSLQDLSPLLSRFYRDNDLDTKRLGPTSLMGWSI